MPTPFLFNYCCPRKMAVLTGVERGRGLSGLSQNRVVGAQKCGLVSGIGSVAVSDRPAASGDSGLSQDVVESRLRQRRGSSA